MVGTGARFFYGLFAFGLIAAGVYGLASGGEPLGVISIGWKGGVGEHFGYAVLTLFATSALVLAVFSSVLRDVDPAVVAAASPTDALPEVPAPATGSVWPLVAAIGLIITALGLVTGSWLFALGLIVIAVTIVEWAVRAWADRATGDPVVNQAIRDRLMAPIEVPAAALIVLAFVVLGISRVLLAVSATTSVVIGVVLLAALILGALAVLAWPEKSRRIATVLLVVGALAVIAGGIAGVAAGSREFHHEEPTHEGGE
jgi:Cytochrome c oxidase subunit IV